MAIAPHVISRRPFSGYELEAVFHLIAGSLIACHCVNFAGQLLEASMSSARLRYGAMAGAEPAQFDAAGRCAFTRQGFTQKDQFTKHFTLAEGTGRHD